MARYIMEEMPDIQKTGKKFISKVCTDRQYKHKRISTTGGISNWYWRQKAYCYFQTAIEMAHLMAEGRSVKIDGIGTTAPSSAGAETRNRKMRKKVGKTPQRAKVFYRRC